MSEAAEPTYESWFETHGKRHANIVGRLARDGRSPEQIIAYFDFDRMRETEPDFCALYAKCTRCHNLAPLNCYLCGCPYFRFYRAPVREEDGTHRYSDCAAASRFARWFVKDGAKHLDCSDCLVPHRMGVIKKWFDPDWFASMRGVAAAAHSTEAM